MKLSNKTIWITGASSGIGEALAKQLSALGANLILSARRMEVLEKVKASCAFPDNIHLVQLDLKDHGSFDEKTEDAIAAFGQIDILINNGGISQRSLVKETSLDVDKELMNVNYFGTIGLTKSLLPHMLEGGSGHFVAVTSVTGLFESPYRSGYAASKHAIHGFYDSMRAELEDEGIKVTLCAPGFVRTNVSINAVTGDGSKLGKMDDAQAKGISAETCAKGIIKAIKKQKRVVYIGKEELCRLCQTIFPRALCDNCKAR
jgi:dehydrogenase/reductase SDR family protein 7B